MNPSELDELKKKRLEEIQRAYGGQADGSIQQQVAEVENFVKAHMSKDALSRYSNLKIAFPEKAMQVLGMLAQAIQSYGLKEISDAQLKELLQRLSSQKKDFNIKFERK